MNQFNKFRDFVHGNLSPGGSKNDRQLISVVVKEEKHVDNIKSILTTAEKKLSNSLVTNTKGSEQKTKKLPSASLTKFFNEASETLSSTKNDSVLSKTLLTCSELHNDFSRILGETEADVEQKCVTPINRYLTADLPSIHRAKKQLNKSLEELKAARAKCESFQKSISQSTTNLNTADLKLEPLKKEVESCEQKLEQCRDTYEIEMFAFLAKEPEISEIFLQYIKALEVYHDQMLNQIRHYIPILEGVLRNSTQKPVFGLTLEEHVRSTGKRLSLVIEKCVEYLAPFVKEEGLFRISGSIMKMKRIRNAFNAGQFEALEELKNDAAALVSTLKSYLRELPEPLLTFGLYQQWADAARIPDQKERLQAIWSVCNQLPEPNRDNLCYLLNFLHALTRHSKQNKMSSQNLAIALGPSLLWCATDPFDLSISNHLPVIVEALITYFDYFFPNAQELVPECKKITEIIEQTLNGHPNQSINHDRITHGGAVNHQSPKATNHPSHHQQPNKNGGNNGKKLPAPKPPGSSPVPAPIQSHSPPVEPQNGSESPTGHLNTFGNQIRLKSKIGSFKFTKKPASFESNSKNNPVTVPTRPQPPPRAESPSILQQQIYLRKSPTPISNSEIRNTTPRPRSVCERPMVAPPSVPPRPSLLPAPAKTVENSHSPTVSDNATALNDSDLNADLNHIDSDSESLPSIRTGDVKVSPEKVAVHLEEDDEPEASEPGSYKRLYPSMESVDSDVRPLIITDSGNDSLASTTDTAPLPQKPPRVHLSSPSSSSNLSLNNQQQQRPPAETKKQHQRSESLPGGNPADLDGSNQPTTRERSESSASGSAVTDATDINQTYL